MPLTTPLLSEIAENVVSSIEAKLNQTVPALAKTVWRVWGYGVAGVWMLLYKNGVWNLNQIFPQTASAKYLEILGENKKVPRVPAIAWEGDVNVTYGTAPPGGYRDVEAGEQMVNQQTQVVYIVTTTTPITTPGGNAIPLKAATAGEISDLNIGDELTFLDPSNLPAENAPVSTVTTQGTDQEDLEVYRQRVIDAFQRQPQGGALADYERWSNETPNVINSYPYPDATRPTYLDIYIEVDNQPDGIPTAVELAAALDYVTNDPITGLQTRKPATDNPTMLAITRLAYDVTITGLSPTSTDIQQAIQDAVDAYFAEREPFITGLSTIRLDRITLGAVTGIASEAAAAQGSTFSSLLLERGGNPITDETLGDGEKAKSNPITWL